MILKRMVICLAVTSVILFIASQAAWYRTENGPKSKNGKKWPKNRKWPSARNREKIRFGVISLFCRHLGVQTSCFVARGPKTTQNRLITYKVRGLDHADQGVCLPFPGFCSKRTVGVKPRLLEANTVHCGGLVGLGIAKLRSQSCADKSFFSNPLRLWASRSWKHPKGTRPKGTGRELTFRQSSSEILVKF